MPSERLLLLHCISQVSNYYINGGICLTRCTYRDISIVMFDQEYTVATEILDIHEPWLYLVCCPFGGRAMDQSVTSPEYCGRLGFFVNTSKARGLYRMQ
jgi:hypothetical protein